MGIKELIPIAKPYLGEEEAAAARETILSGWVTQGPKVKQFEDNFAAFVSSKYACAVSSCTTALHLALLVVGVKPGDVVITVSHSFIATANAVRHCGAEPVFVDIDPDTFNMSPELLKKCLYKDCEVQDGLLFYRDVSKLAVSESPLCHLANKKSKSKNFRIGRIAAIMPVHQMGMPCDLDAILSLAREFNLLVVEDAACATGSEIKINARWEKIGKPHGDIACFSFHPRKLLTTGDGGMITTNNPEYDKKFRLLRHHGMSVPDTVRHRAKKIIFEEYVLTGYNYRMTDIQAAVGTEQLKKLPEIIVKRKNIVRFYEKYLSDIRWLKLPVQPDYALCNWQSYPVKIMPGAPNSRNKLMQYLLDNKVTTKPGIMNIHKEKAYKNSNFSSLSESEKSRESVLLFPLYHNLTENEVKEISNLIRQL